MSIVAIIPARMGSTRFPGKPLAPILGKPMIGWVYEQVIKASLLDLTVVATCDDEILEYITSIGGAAIMTARHHERASDRCAEALMILEKMRNQKFDIVVMIQGDEPLIKSEMIEQAVGPLLLDEDVQVVNLLGKIKDVAEFEDRNCIKVVTDLNGDALYFSREPIPTRSMTEEIPMGKQVCVVPFRRDFLLRYTQLEPTPLEAVESIDMMRVLEHGYKVRLVPTRHESHAVDTPADLTTIEALFRKSR